MSLIIQDRRPRNEKTKKKSRVTKDSLGKAFTQYNKHMKKVGKRMYG